MILLLCRLRDSITDIRDHVCENPPCLHILQSQLYVLQQKHMLTKYVTGSANFSTLVCKFQPTFKSHNSCTVSCNTVKIYRATF